MSQVSGTTCQAKPGLRSLITMHYTTTGAVQECSLPRKIPYFPCFARKNSQWHKKPSPAEFL
jgi:hypothetical protein